MIEFGCLIMPSIDGVEREYGHFSVESRLDFINIVQYDSPCCIAYNYKIREFKLRDSCVSFTEIGIIIEGRVDSLKVKLNLGSIHKSMAYLHFMEKHQDEIEWKASMKFLQCDTINDYVTLKISKEKE